jgi:hypothetical protein
MTRQRVTRQRVTGRRVTGQRVTRQRVTRQRVSGRLVHALVRCHPRRWRERYGEEYTALLNDLITGTGPHERLRIVANALAGALDARLAPIGGTTMSTSPLTTAVWAAGLFTVAGIGFQKLTEDPGPGGHPAMSLSFTLLVVAAAVALAALVATALPAAGRMLRGQAAGAWLPAAVPLVAVAAWFGLIQLGRHIAGSRDVHSGPGVAAAVLVFGSGLGVVAATAAAATTVLRRVGPAGPPRLRPIGLTVLGAGMAVATLACLAWGLAVHSAQPSRFSGHDGLLAGPFTASWITVLVLMAAATAMAARAASRQLKIEGVPR